MREGEKKIDSSAAGAAPIAPAQAAPAASRIDQLRSERADLVRQMKRSKGRYGEDRYLARIDREIASLERSTEA